MSDDFDLRVIDQRHQPDPEFVAALAERINAIIAGSDSAFVPTDEVAVVEPTFRRRRRRALWFGGTAIVAAAALIAGALLLPDNDPTRRVETTPAGPGTTLAPGFQPPTAPNGWVAYARRTATNDLDVFLTREGEEPRRVSGSDSDRTDEGCPTFSPDGRRLAYEQTTDGRPGERDLLITDVRDKGATSDTHSVKLAGLSPAEGATTCAIWSPDGRWLSLGSGNQVWLVDTVSEELRRLDGYTATDLDWRPGTDELAIVADGVVQMYSVATDEVRPLGVEGASQLAWSPDGLMIAVARRGEQDRERLWLVDADGAGERALTNEYRVHEGVGPVWSPDGQYIAYERLFESMRSAPGVSTDEAHDVVLVVANEDDPDNPMGTELVIPPVLQANHAGPWSVDNVSWSPDASMVLVTAWNDAPTWGAGVFAIPVDATKKPAVLVETGADAGLSLPMQAWGRQPSR